MLMAFAALLVTTRAVVRHCRNFGKAQKYIKQMVVLWEVKYQMHSTQLSSLQSNVYKEEFDERNSTQDSEANRAREHKHSGLDLHTHELSVLTPTSQWLTKLSQWLAITWMSRCAAN